MVEASLFIPLLIIAIVQMVKMKVPAINGWWTVGLALIVGVLVAVFDQAIGVMNISIAQGLIYALGAVGITVTASKAGGGARGDTPT
jgi:hypothetical protein